MTPTIAHVPTGIVHGQPPADAVIEKVPREPSRLAHKTNSSKVFRYFSLGSTIVDTGGEFILRDRVELRKAQRRTEE